MNSAFACFVFRVKKKHPRKKDNGKPQADECYSVACGHLRFFNALYFLREYDVNGGFN